VIVTYHISAIVILPDGTIFVLFDPDPPAVLLTAGQQYWIVVSRTGAVDGAKYYAWQTDTTSPTYADGTAATFDGTTWTANATQDRRFGVYALEAAADCDGDGTSDAAEVTAGTNPLAPAAPGGTFDSDGDGWCSDAEETAMGFNPTKWYDYFDAPVPANFPDVKNGVANPNGVRNGAISLGDVGAVLTYTGTAPTAVCGDNPNGLGVDYDCDKNGDGVPDGVDYDRSPSAVPNPPWDAGPPNNAISLADVGAVLAQVGLSCGQKGAR
jgi:hypothetical protein